MPTSRVLIACGGMCWPFVFPHVTLLKKNSDGLLLALSSSTVTLTALVFLCQSMRLYAGVFVVIYCA